MDKSKTKARKDKQVGVTETFMVAKLGEAGFEKAKKNGEIMAVIDESTGSTFWTQRTLEISNKEEVKQGTHSAGSHALSSDEFRKHQACNIREKVRLGWATRQQNPFGLWVFADDCKCLPALLVEMLITDGTL